MFPLLPILVLIPLLFILPLFAFEERHSFQIAFTSSLLVLIICGYIAYLGTQGGLGALSFGLAYLPSLGVNMSLQVTQYTDLLLVLSAVVFFAASAAAPAFIKESGRKYNLLFLLAFSSAMGFFLSGNLFVFLVFWELGEFAMFFMLYLFGGFDRRYAAVKFIVYSAVAGMCLLIGILILYSSLPTPTFDIATITGQAASIPVSAQLSAALFLVAAFLIKMPIFPFHEWLPDAYAEAPAPGSMVLAGVMSRFGAYGMFLALLMLPALSAYSTLLAALFGFSALYGAIVAIRQPNIKRLSAFSSMAGTGIIALGLASATALGTDGAFYAMLSCGAVTSLMFLLAGMVDESFGTPLLARVKGVIKSFPALAYSFVFGAFATIGIPLTGGFVAELLIFAGAFKAYGAVGIVPIAALALLGGYLFYVLEGSFLDASSATEPYLNPRKCAYAAAGFLIAAILLFGLVPWLFLSVPGSVLV